MSQVDAAEQIAGIKSRSAANAGPRGLTLLRRWSGSLSARLLAIAAMFILLAETLIFIPALVTLRENWVGERINAAELALLSANSSGDWASTTSATALMQSAGITAITLQSGNEPLAQLGEASNRPLPRIDLETETVGEAISGSLRSLFGNGPGLVEIDTRPAFNAALRVSLQVETDSLHQAKVRRAWSVLFSSLAVAALVGMFMLVALFDGLVQPMRRLTAAILRFQRNPDDPTATFRASGRGDEIGEAEAALAEMQTTLRTAMLQQQRMAQMGMSVAKISHDLRHSLGSAQLVSERLASVEDPVVQRSLPRLERALERAATLAESTLRYGRAEEKAPQAKPVLLQSLRDDVEESALAGLQGITLAGICPDPDVAVLADPDHLHRIVTNLVRNAGLAIAATGKTGTITVEAVKAGSSVTLRIIDTGPGIPERVRANLFVPWQAGSASGTGLGLAIARELAVANRGTLELESTNAGGTIFSLKLPAA
jgi:signal transduction histidine kinase